jgi:hypothetical protein
MGKIRRNISENRLRKRRIKRKGKIKTKRQFLLHDLRLKGIGDVRPENRVSTPGSEFFSLLHNVQTGTEAYQISYPMRNER